MFETKAWNVGQTPDPPRATVEPAVFIHTLNTCVVIYWVGPF